MNILFNDIVLKPDEGEELLTEKIKKIYGIEFSDHLIIRKSLDARKKDNIVYRYKVAVNIINECEARRILSLPGVEKYIQKQCTVTKCGQGKKRILIAGSGPAGLFCALRLIEAGADAAVFERGKSIEERMKDIGLLESEGILDPESNVLFGEGGAGTYSDGKLTTRINRPEVTWFYEKLREHDAPGEIQYDSKPHIGTDRLKAIIQSIRNKILHCENIYFNEKVVDCIIRDGKIRSIITSKGKEYDCDILVLAIGHSARDTFQILRQRGVRFEKKGFAAGIRIEHPAALIDLIQYGKSKYLKILPASDYRLAYNNNKSKRGVYSFCMCPGGSVINSSSMENMLCTNGMSFSNRNGHFSNSAIVVSVKEDDLNDDPFSGISFQESIEKAAFVSGGGEFTAPAQRITSFLKNKVDNDLPPVSYKRGVTPADIRDYLPEFISDEIRNAFYSFDKKMRGFISEDGILIGAETRTSSPVRMPRGNDYQSVDVDGIFPIGEGAGYSGGIVSSAVDGIKAADMIISNLLL